jgi:hypothetical protein
MSNLLFADTYIKFIDRKVRFVNIIQFFMMPPPTVIKIINMGLLIGRQYHEPNVCFVTQNVCYVYAIYFI